MLTFLLWFVLLCVVGLAVCVVADAVQPWLFPEDFEDDLDD